MIVKKKKGFNKAFYSLSEFSDRFTVYPIQSNYFSITDPSTFEQEVLKISESDIYKNIESEFYEKDIDYSYYFHFSANHFSFFFSKNDDLFTRSTWLKYDALSDRVSLNSVYPLFMRPSFNTVLNYKIHRDTFPAFFQEKLDSLNEDANYDFQLSNWFSLFEASYKIVDCDSKVLCKKKN